jgi:DMSO/TMAO reductase YedYZ molybdopterin-dependent catalytic subunit
MWCRTLRAVMLEVVMAELERHGKPAMNPPHRFLVEHVRLTRRFFLRAGLAGSAAPLGWLTAHAAEVNSPELARALEKLEPFFTTQEEFRDVSRGTPLPHKLPDDKKREVGLTRETWKLEIVSDTKYPATLGKQFTRKDDTALTFDDLMRLAAKHAVRFPKVMTCLNIGCPLGNGIWEGVPLRDLVWLTQPKENLRRLSYFGYHNDDPKQIFQSSLPIGRVLEDPYDLPPIIACYKLNGDWLNSTRGGPVRIVVPEGYGFKSVKWLQRVTLTNLAHADDTYAGGNNDIDSPLKSFAATLLVPRDVKKDAPIPVTGYAQVGISGVTKVQTWIQPKDKEWPKDDPYFATAPWVDAKLLPPPARWGGNLESIPKGTHGFDDAGKPKTWPLRLGKVHWAALLPGLPAGEYHLRSRTVDDKGHGQPMPRPFKKSGHAAIEAVTIRVKD